MITSNGCRDVKELGVDAFASWAEGKSAVRSQEQLGLEEDILDRITKNPTNKLHSKDRVVGSKPELLSAVSEVTGPSGDETDILSKSLEKSGINKTNTEKETIKTNPTRMLTIRDVEKNATESSGTSSTGRKNAKTAADADKGAIPKRFVHKESEESGGVHKESGAASSKSPEAMKGKIVMAGEGGSNDTEKSDKGGKNDLARKRKRHPKKRAGGTKDCEKDESTKKS
uniref:Uncharacterized protein n=1 Tax=Strigamia maritima TaxID=126957 RepID=T1INZ7_STRMM